jgi:nitrogen regulatory protein P-II 1
MVEAIVNDSKMQEVHDLLARVGVDGMTVAEVQGYGHEKGQVEHYRNVPREVPYVRRLKVEIVVEDGRAPALVEELIRATRTGRVGDGKIFVLPVEDVIRIRTNERGRDAL